MGTYQRGRFSFLGSTLPGPWFFCSSQDWLLPDSWPSFSPDPLPHHLGPLVPSLLLWVPHFLNSVVLSFGFDFWLLSRLRGCSPVASWYSESIPVDPTRASLGPPLVVAEHRIPGWKAVPSEVERYGIQGSPCWGCSGFLSCAFSLQYLLQLLFYSQVSWKCAAVWVLRLACFLFFETHSGIGPCGLICWFFMSLFFLMYFSGRIFQPSSIS